MKTSEFSSKESSHRQPAAQATGPQVSQLAVVDIDSSPRMQLQRREIEAGFGRDALQRQTQGPEEGTFARLAQSPGAARALGLVQDSPSHADAQAGGAGVFQLVKWESHGAKKFNAVWYFKDAESARAALAIELGAFTENLKETDWPLALEFATNRDEGADSALKLLHGTAEENLRRARIKERRDAVDDAGLRNGVDALGLSAIATAALKLGLDLYIEGNLNGGIGNSWTKTQVNAAIDEVDGGENYEIVGIEDQQDDDTRTGIVIRDVHKATDKAAQGKGSVYRGSDVQANINMKVFGRLVQVHLNVG